MYSSMHLSLLGCWHHLYRYRNNLYSLSRDSWLDNKASMSSSSKSSTFPVATSSIIWSLSNNFALWYNFCQTNSSFFSSFVGACKICSLISTLSPVLAASMARENKAATILHSVELIPLLSAHLSNKLSSLPTTALLYLAKYFRKSSCVRFVLLAELAAGYWLGSVPFFGTSSSSQQTKNLSPSRSLPAISSGCGRLPCVGKTMQSTR